jgi:hypothetical protein
MKKLFTFISLVLFAANVFANTPYKNLYAEAEVTPAAAGTVYLDAKDDGDREFVKEMSPDYVDKAIFKATLGENGGGDDGEADGYRGKRGTYETKLYVDPADGYEFVCLSSVDKSDDPNAVYTYAECYKPFSGGSQQDRVYDWNLYANAGDGILININNEDHPQDGDSNEGPKREECFSSGVWNDTPDSYIYVIFRKTGEEYPKLVAGEANAISSVVTKDNTKAPIYNIAGQKIAAEVKGIIIRNGRKVLNK